LDESEKITLDAEDFIVCTEDNVIMDDDKEFKTYLDDPLYSKDFPEYEEVDVEELDPEKDMLNDVLNENDDIISEAEEELRGILAQMDDDQVINFENGGITLDEVWPYDDEGDNIIVYNIDSNGYMEIAQSDDLFSAFQLIDADDIFTICDVLKDLLDNEKDYPEYDDVEDDEYVPRVEKMKRRGRLDEKKKGCCPDARKMNECSDLSIDNILADIDNKVLNENKKIESAKERKLEAKTLKALTEHRYSLHPNVSYNGKSFEKMTLKELKTLYEAVNASVNELMFRSLNENVVEQKMLDTINKKK